MPLLKLELSQELLDTVQTVEARADDCWRELQILGHPSDVAVWALLAEAAWADQGIPRLGRQTLYRQARHQ
jgi:hypothetical protein